jgi:hypothetical protein
MRDCGDDVLLSHPFTGTVVERDADGGGIGDDIGVGNVNDAMYVSLPDEPPSTSALLAMYAPASAATSAAAAAAAATVAAVVIAAAVAVSYPLPFNAGTSLSSPVASSSTENEHSGPSPHPSANKSSAPPCISPGVGDLPKNAFAVVGTALVVVLSILFLNAT